jgi:hypothetical protein
MTDGRDASALEPLIGTWSLEVKFPTGDLPEVPAQSTFEWLFGRAFVLQRDTIDHPDAPNGHIIMAPDPGRPGGWTQHYFDSRGVVRLYDMSFDGHTWTLARRAADFSPLDFAQRFTADLGDGGDTLTGRWEIAPEGEDWQLDFRLTCRRVG